MRTSLPSRLPPDWLALTAWFAPRAVRRGLPVASMPIASTDAASQITNITPKTAQPCRLERTRIPKA